MSQHEKSIDFIRCCGNHLKLSTTPIITACMLYHRVVKKQLESKNRSGMIEKYLLSTTCLYLATKAEEEPKQIRDIINVAYRYLHPDEKPLEIGDVYFKLRDSVTTCELIIVRYLNFQISFDNPLKYTLIFCQSLEDWCPDRHQWRQSNIPQICWNIINDLCYLPLAVIYPPEVVAATVLYIALKTTSVEVVEDKHDKRWFEVLAPGVKERNLQDIACKIFCLYEYQEAKK